MDPNYSEYYNELGNILQELEQHQLAVELYTEAIKRSAPYPEVFFNKAVCHLRLGELEAALADFDTSLDLNPNQPQAHALRADILGEQGSTSEALHGYDAAIRLGWDFGRDPGQSRRLALQQWRIRPGADGHERSDRVGSG